MKIVIDIDVERYKDIQRIAEVQVERKHFQTAEQIISKGVPLEQEVMKNEKRTPEDV